ncbi:alkaline phosphatase D family protein [Sphingomonas sp. AOB5]|uniref:alkaline phosphatase D family protein n=1 Tax=Sphingomonas sp. AOB5 TaxID=3034017 RepID=UPI0023F71469|nr:alkaline phosphatase D family protein [Sphingomonas sp. AOB5]MDF7776700.1 alkaline phosphatase D family protein [Sphingomonas sp. AOB5]
MTFRIDRRSVLVTASLGVAAFAIPGFALAGTVADLRGFTHSVASGEPGTDTMLLWTRYQPASGDSARLRAEVSETADFARIVSGGEALTGPWRDWTSKIVVEGLKPGTRYFYRFVAPDGSFSPVGRTRTLPVGNVRRFGIAIFSCSNLPFGYFNAYGHAAARDDVDLAVHLGDYFYEYPKGAYSPERGAVDGRVPLPEGETLILADYRLRYASYRADPDLQALHANKPMLVQMDDHESANNSWEGGAQNHQANEGDWSIRRGAALQAWREWMPVSDRPFAAYDVGTLVTLFRTETRLLGRTPERSLYRYLTAADPVKALTQFRDSEWMDPSVSMLGSEQESWLYHAMAKSVRQGQRWQLAGFGTIMGRTSAPAEALDWLKADTPERVRNYVTAGVNAGKLGLPIDMDGWGGYPAARARFLKAAQQAGSNLIVIAGDSHNAWAYDLGQDGKPAGVEFAGQSVTSPGYESSTGADPKTVAAALVAKNAELKWCDTSRRGYMAMTLTPEKVSNDWVFVDTILERNLKASVGHTATVMRGRNVMG